MIHTRRAAIAFGIAALFSLTGCGNLTVITLLNSIVTACEVVLPFIPGISPGDRAALSAYIDEALAITQSLITSINNGQVTTGIAAAVAAFQKLVLPQLKGSIPVAASIALAVIANAIADFLKPYKVIAASGLKIPRPTRLQNMQLQAISARAAAVRRALPHPPSRPIALTGEWCSPPLVVGTIDGQPVCGTLTAPIKQ